MKSGSMVLLWLLAFALAHLQAAPKQLALTPPMGWSSWNHFADNIDDKTIREIADAMVTSGMRDAGYVYVNIDDGWQGKRDAQGVLQPNDKFADIKALANYVHSKGLKLGIYSSPGPKTCANYEGSYKHEQIDAKTFADWGIDYLKYDWCSADKVYDEKQDMQVVYQRMGDALAATGREIVYSLCQYGHLEVWKWGARVGGNSWRTTGDIADNWQSMSTIGFDKDRDLAEFAGPGHWNDPDMLEVGNGGMTAEEYRTHITLWAILAAPLLAGNDVRSMNDETKAILMNKEVLSVNQDKLGVQGKPVWKDGELEIWAKQLTGGQYAVGLFNRGSVTASITARWSHIGLPGKRKAQDLWQNKDIGKVEDYVTNVPAHGVVLLRVSR